MLLTTLALASSLAFQSGLDADPAAETPVPAHLVDAYFDSRFEPGPDDTADLLEALAGAGITDPADVEAAIRAPRALYPAPTGLVGETTRHPVACAHVDYATEFFLYVDPDYTPGDRPLALVVVGHGGNSSMSEEYATRTAQSYLAAYAPGLCETMDVAVVAPVSERGWGPIGYSLVFSTIDRVSRMLPIDPDRIYITGQSMGGHLAYRAALLFPDAWGAVSPHSGGYDFAEKGSIGMLLNVPGISVFGAREPYGINGDNRKNETWGDAHGLDWEFVEKDGGHTIYRDELPRIGRFFMEHPRDLYRDAVYLRRGGSLMFERTWQIDGWPEHTVRTEPTPLRWDHAHWIEVGPRDPDREEPMEVVAQNLGGNRIAVTSTGVRALRIGLHPRMVDLGAPVTVAVNGEVLHEGVVTPDPAAMLEAARAHGDRGRVFQAWLDLEIESDAAVSLGDRWPPANGERAR